MFYLEKNNYIYLIEGIIRSFIATLILLLVISVVTTLTSVPGNIESTLILVTTVISLMYGAIYAAKKIQKKGWLVGIVVAFSYMLILFTILIFKNGFDYFSMKHLFKLLLGLLVGSLSGMLGINI